MTTAQIHPVQFYSKLRWIDGQPLLDVIEPYRRELLTQALFSFDGRSRLLYGTVIAGRARKNWKSADMTLAALYKWLVWDSGGHPSDAYILSNDLEQSQGIQEIAERVILANPILQDEVEILGKSIRRRDGKGSLTPLPSRGAAGLHGRTGAFIGFEECHGFTNYDLIRAITPDPTRDDVTVWFTSYSPVAAREGIPMHDMLTAARAGKMPRTLLSWYCGDWSTDPDFQDPDMSAEDRANPSKGTFADPDYLAHARANLDANSYRMLHLNLPSSPPGAAYSADAVARCVLTGTRSLPREHGVREYAAYDGSGGSYADAVLAISRFDVARSNLARTAELRGRRVLANGRQGLVMDRAALLSRCADAYQGIRDARGMNAIIRAVERAEDALGALILALEPDDIETRATVARLVDFRDLSRSMRRIS